MYLGCSNKPVTVIEKLVIVLHGFVARVTLNFFLLDYFLKKKKNTRPKKNPSIFVLPNKLLLQTEKLTLRALFICYLRLSVNVCQADIQLVSSRIHMGNFYLNLNTYTKK